MPRPIKPTVDNFSTLQLQITNTARQQIRDREARRETHESVLPTGPYYPTRDLGRNSVSQALRLSAQARNDARYTLNPILGHEDLLEHEEQQLERLERFFRPPLRIQRPLKKMILPSAHLAELIEPTATQQFPSFPFTTLPKEIRIMIFDQFDAPQPRFVHVALVNEAPRGAYGFNLFYKTINTSVPVILQINRESRKHGLKRYIPAFKNLDQDGNVEDQIYVNPKLDTIIFELPIEIKRYPRVQYSTSKPSPWTSETHTIFRLTNFKFAHGDEWLGDDIVPGSDDAFGYDYRYKSYLVVVPKSQTVDWSVKVEMEDVERGGTFNCMIVGPVIMPPDTVRTRGAMPGDWYQYSANLVKALENDTMVERRPLGDDPHRFWG